MTTPKTAPFVILNNQEILVSDLTAQDKFKIAENLVSREVLQNASYLIDGLLGLANKSDDHSIAEDIYSIATQESEPLDAKRECQLNGWERSDEMDKVRLDAFCRKEGLTVFASMSNTYINVDNAEYYENLEDWAELAGLENYDLEQEPLETLEYWIVSDYLARHLENTTDIYNLNIWGRSCSGQAIALDDDIQALAVDLATITP